MDFRGWILPMSGSFPFHMHLSLPYVHLGQAAAGRPCPHLCKHMQAHVVEISIRILEPCIACRLTRAVSDTYPFSLTSYLPCRLEIQARAFRSSPSPRLAADLLYWDSGKTTVDGHLSSYEPQFGSRFIAWASDSVKGRLAQPCVHGLWHASQTGRLYD